MRTARHLRATAFTIEAVNDCAGVLDGTSTVDARGTCDADCANALRC